MGLNIILAGLACGEQRLWMNADGNRSVRGEYVTQDQTTVTIRRSDFKEVKIPIQSLHASDQKWLVEAKTGKTNSAKTGSSSKPQAALTAGGLGIMTSLKFGSTRNEVMATLKASKEVEPTIAETLIGRTGLNGIYGLRSQIGGLKATLFFDWDDSQGLKEIIVQTKSLPMSEQKTVLEPCWQEMIAYLTELHGAPSQANPVLQLQTIPDGTMFGTHMWNLSEGVSLIVGAAREGGNYQIAARIVKGS